MTKKAAVAKEDKKVEEFTQDATALEVRAKKIAVIETEEHLVEARDLRALVADYKRKVKDYFGPSKKQAAELHKTIVAQEKAALAPAEEIDALVVEALRQHALRIEAERRAAEEQAAQERRRLEAEAEEQRKMAEDLRAAGETDAAEAAEEEASESLAAYRDPTAFAPPAAPKVTGVSFRTKYRFEVVDVAQIPRRFMLPNESLIQELCDRNGDAAEGICPGIKVTVDKIPVRR